MCFYFSYLKKTQGRWALVSSFFLQFPIDAERFLFFSKYVFVVLRLNLCVCLSSLAISGIHFSFKMCIGGELKLSCSSFEKFAEFRFLPFSTRMFIKEPTLSQYASVQDLMFMCWVTCLWIHKRCSRFSYYIYRLRAIVWNLIILYL